MHALMRIPVFLMPPILPVDSNLAFVELRATRSASANRSVAALNGNTTCTATAQHVRQHLYCPIIHRCPCSDPVPDSAATRQHLTATTDRNAPGSPRVATRGRLHPREQRCCSYNTATYKLATRDSCSVCGFAMRTAVLAAMCGRCRESGSRKPRTATAADTIYMRRSQRN